MVVRKRGPARWSCATRALALFAQTAGAGRPAALLEKVAPGAWWSGSAAGGQVADWGKQGSCSRTRVPLVLGPGPAQGRQGVLPLLCPHGAASGSRRAGQNAFPCPLSRDPPHFSDGGAPLGLSHLKGLPGTTLQVHWVRGFTLECIQTH